MSDQHNIDMNNEFRNERQERLRDANRRAKALTPAEVAELRDKNTRLQSEVERLRGRCGELEKVVDDGSDAWLLRKQAEAVESARDEICNRAGSPSWHSVELTDYAQRLRQQADEAGG